MNQIAILNKDDLRQIMFEALDQYEIKKESTHLLTINKVAKRLRKSHKAVSKLVADGFIKSTKSGLISYEELENYLKNRE